MSRLPGRGWDLVLIWAVLVAGLACLGLVAYLSVAQPDWGTTTTVTISGSHHHHHRACR